MTGVVALDAFGGVRVLNDAASRIIGAGIGLTIRHDRLAAASRCDTAAIQRLVQTVSSSPVAGGEEFGPVTLRQWDGRERLLVTIIAMPRQTSPVPEDHALAMIVVIRELQSDRMAMDRRIGDVSRRFALSAGEQSIVKHLLDARNLREAAERAGIGYETARTQIKSAFGKTNTASQIELLRLVSR